MDHDELTSKKPNDLDLHCLKNKIYLSLEWKDLTNKSRTISITKENGIVIIS